MSPFTKYIPKIDGTAVDDAEDLHLVMPMYNLIKYSNYSETTGILWFYSKYEATNLIIRLQTLIIWNLSSLRLNY